MLMTGFNAQPVMPSRPGLGGQRGGAAMEFALILPLLILLTYGLIVYAYVFVLQESINFAAQEAAEAAVRVDPTTPDYNTQVISESRATAAAVLNWLPDSQKQRVLGNENNQVQVTIAPSAADPSNDAVTVVLTFALNNPTPMFMTLDLPLIGNAPPIPNQLTATGVATL